MTGVIPPQYVDDVGYPIDQARGVDSSGLKRSLIGEVSQLPTAQLPTAQLPTAQLPTGGVRFFSRWGLRFLLSLFCAIDDGSIKSVADGR